MDNQTVVSVTSGSDEEVVRVPKAVYTRTVARFRQQQRQLQAAENLQRLLHDKEQQVMAEREKNEQLQLTMERNEMRYSSLMRLYSGAAVNVLPVATTSGMLETDSGPLASSDVETDGEPVCVAAGLQHISDYAPEALDSKNSKVVRLRNSPTGQLTPAVTVPLTSVTASSAVSSVGCTAATLDARLDSTSCTSSAYSTCSVSTASGQVSSLYTSSSIASGTSRDLLDKVMQQNARLKKTLRDLLSQKGLSVSSYLDKQEYEDAAEILRHDLREARSHVKQLKGIIGSRDSGDIDKLTAHCASLTDKVVTLERKLAISQAYADALKQAHDKWKQDVDSSHHTDTAAQSSEVSHEKYAQLLEDLQQVKLSCKEFEARSETAENQLKAAEHELANKESQLTQLDDLKHRCQSLLEERELNQSQIAAFQEDFRIEQKEKEEQKKAYEVNLAKHQEWIRRLAAEAQKLRTSWQDEIDKGAQVEKKLLSMQQLPSPTHPERVVPGSCGASVTPKLDVLPRLTGNVGEDGAPEGKPSSVMEISRSGNFSCPRCEREFPPTEEKKWQQHLLRCVDD